jgi:hypothetical protein
METVTVWFLVLFLNNYGSSHGNSVIMDDFPTKASCEETLSNIRKMGNGNRQRGLDEKYASNSVVSYGYCEQRPKIVKK